ncbi:efflux RND transporter permease subunit [Mucilaginibacter sp. Bleaf8]|uniref:efflux RND transporter permease subunit n=1 Tax=Mucilaginibacter sp. Bleaf8 TaxID=2834430 RepID=UPI001BCDFDEE|nr:efflux RND transporter permease subunit [Mucilaginibacter sp. Bleaf8]MBS7564856.1 efflux RND transporter permease subunit [Mucilaginibacter sp. Bleaf8]
MANKKKSFNLIELSMRYRNVSFTIAAMLVLVGVYSLLGMSRSENPEFTIRQALVYAVYPGASEKQVENEVTKPMEQYLFSFKEVRKEKTYSTTKEGVVYINLELNEWVKDADRVWSTIQHGLNSFKAQNLPQNVQGPLVNSNFGETVALLIAVSSPQRSYQDLDKLLDRVEDNVKVNKKVSRITRVGGLPEQVLVQVDDDKLSQYGIDFNRVADVLKNQNQTTGGGEVKLPQSNVPIFGNNQFRSIADIEDQIIYTDSSANIVRLRDVANIKRTYEDTTQMIEMGGQPVMMLSVEMQKGNNMTEFGKEIDKQLALAKKQLPPDVKVDTIVNQPEVVAESIKHFLVEFAIAIGSVIVVVILLLPFRIALISAIACPLSIMITFAISNMIGLQLHQVTLAGLIVVLGMVVDDAIVVVDNYVERLDHGTKPWEAAWKSATQLFIPVLTATISIIFAFAPLAMFLPGQQKEFAGSLPVIVGIALSTSFVVSMLIVPAIAFLTIKKGLKQDEEKEGNEHKKSILDRVQEKYDKAVEWAFAHSTLIVWIGVASVFLGGFLMTKVKQQFLSNAERNQFNLELWLPPGTPYKETEAAVRKVEAAIKGDKRITRVASFIGTSSPRFYVTYAPENPRENYAQIFINTTDNEATDELSAEYIEKFHNYLPEGFVRVHRLSFLNAKAPLEIRVISENFDDLRKVGDSVKTMVSQLKGTNWVRDDFEEDYVAVGGHVQQDKARRLGLTNSQITQTLGGGLQGVPVSTLYEGKTPISIVLRYDEKYRKSFDRLRGVHITNQQGKKIQLRDVADFTPEWHMGNIMHRNGLRMLTVMSEAQNGVVAADMLKQIKPRIEKMHLPYGVRIQYGGDQEATEENVPGLSMALLASIILIFLTMLIQFRSLKKTFIILCTFPLSLLGASIGLLVTGNAFSFTAFMGIISLIGIVVRNGIILVDFADEMGRDEGLDIRESAMHAAKRRMRPIFLTTAAAAVGVTPMVVGGSPLWGPLGSVLAFGLIVSMFFTLFIIPILYFKWIKPEKDKPEEHDEDEQVEVAQADPAI